MDWPAIFRKNHNDVYLSDVFFPVASFIAASLFVSLERSLFVSFLIGSISVILNLKWHLRGRTWFWLILGLFFVINAIAIFTAPIPHEFKMAAAFAPLVIAEGMALLGVIGYVERRVS